jgi:hypothetical protein
MTIQASYDLRIKTHQSPRRCATCPPDRVCAWACIQGANVEDLIAGLVLQSEGKLTPPFPDPGAQAAEDALWASFNLIER